MSEALDNTFTGATTPEGGPWPDPVDGDAKDYSRAAEYDGHAQSIGAYLHSISKRPLLSPTRERLLARRVKAGSKAAKNELVERNLRLVVHATKRYTRLGVDFEELVQEGTLGLIRAAEKFEPEKGYKFSTCATWWIRQAAGRAVFNKSRSVRLPPVHFHEQLRALRQAEAGLTVKLGKEPAKEELAKELNLSTRKVGEMLRMRQSVASLDAPASEAGRAGDADASVLGDFLADDKQSEEAEEMVAAALDSESVREAVDELSEPERSVLIGRYGLDGAEYQTLQQVADRLGPSREAIRKHQMTAEKKLKSAMLARKTA